MVVVALPLVPLTLVGLGTVLHGGLTSVAGRVQPLGPRAYAAAACLCAALLTSEVVGTYVLCVRGHALKFPLATFWISLAAARYFCWRSAFSAMAYSGMLLPLPRRIASAIQLTIGGHKLLLDILFGAALQLALFLVSIVPFTSELHVVFLFRTHKHGLRASSRKQTEGIDASTHDGARLPPTPHARRKFTALFAAGEASHKVGPDSLR